MSVKHTFDQAAATWEQAIFDLATDSDDTFPETFSAIKDINFSSSGFCYSTIQRHGKQATSTNRTEAEVCMLVFI